MFVSLSSAKKRIGELEAELATARENATTVQNSLQAALTERDTFKAERDAANERLAAAESASTTDFQAQIASLNEQLSSRAGEITELNNKLNQAAQDFQAYKDAEGPRFNALLQAELAKSGHPEPVPAVKGENNLSPSTPDVSSLKGIEKTRALLAAKQITQTK